MKDVFFMILRLLLCFVCPDEVHWLEAFEQRTGFGTDKSRYFSLTLPIFATNLRSYEDETVATERLELPVRHGLPAADIDGLPRCRCRHRCCYDARAAHGVGVYGCRKLDAGIVYAR